MAPYWLETDTDRLSSIMASSSNFAAALETWCSINLAELQKKLDGQGIEIVDNQKEGLLGRKALADKTKGASPFETAMHWLNIRQNLKSSPTPTS